MIKLPGNIIKEEQRQKVMNLVYSIAGHPKIDFTSCKRQSSIPELLNDSYFLLHEVFLYKGKLKIDKREVTEVNSSELQLFLLKFIEPRLEGLDLIALSDNKQHLLIFNHDGDIWEKHI